MNAEINTITESIWSAVLGIELEPGTPFLNTHSYDPVITGSISIQGEWNGIIRLHCTAKVARLAASKMFDCPIESVTNEDLCDVVGELTNMISGNIKPLLPGPNLLSLPTIETDIDLETVFELHQSNSICLVSFHCFGDPFQVSVSLANS